MAMQCADQPIWYGNKFVIIYLGRYHLTYGSLKITWVRNRFSNLPEGANAITTQQYARAYMFQVLALLFGNKSQSILHCCFLKLLDDFGVAGEYGWGSATLAFLYKELCTASIQKTTVIVGPVFILQLWAWEHLPYLTSIPINPINLNGEDLYGCRYNIYFLFLHNIVYCSIYPWYFQTLKSVAIINCV